jgi:oligopeptide/dipeptide ABC transporter ATP-binding protein
MMSGQLDANGGRQPTLLEVRNLTTVIGSPTHEAPVVDEVSFDITHGEVLGLVGESGCGKSMTALSIVRLLPRVARIRGGEVLLEGLDLARLDGHAMRGVRGGRIGVVFQDPMESLNPVMPVGRQITETIEQNLGLSRRAARARAIEVLGHVGIPDAARRIDDYPHQFSGGMRQRVMIAIAIACEPALLIADEPTTSLDVTIQAQILELLKRLRDEFGMAILLITHDLGIAAGMCDRINVMYAGRVVESALVDRLFALPQAPYTRALLESIPTPLDVPGTLLRVIEGQPPDPRAFPAGCRFAARCKFARELCREREPDILSRGNGHLARCWATEAAGWLT